MADPEFVRLRVRLLCEQGPATPAANLGRVLTRTVLFRRQPKEVRLGDGRLVPIGWYASDAVFATWRHGEKIYTRALAIAPKIARRGGQIQVRDDGILGFPDWNGTPMRIIGWAHRPEIGFAARDDGGIVSTCLASHCDPDMASGSFTRHASRNSRRSAGGWPASAVEVCNWISGAKLGLMRAMAEFWISTHVGLGDVEQPLAGHSCPRSERDIRPDTPEYDRNWVKFNELLADLDRVEGRVAASRAGATAALARFREPEMKMLTNHQQRSVVAFASILAGLQSAADLDAIDPEIARLRASLLEPAAAVLGG